MDPTASGSSPATESLSKKRKVTGVTVKTYTRHNLLLTDRPHTADMDEDANAQDMAELLFRERTRIALDINPAYVSRLEDRRELGYYPNLANKHLAFTTFDLQVAEIRRCFTDVLTKALTVRYFDRSNLRQAEIDDEMTRIVPLTVRACMCAIYAKLRAIHRQHGRLSNRYPTPPHYNKDIELPLPLAVAIQELGMFQTTNLTQNLILAPTYPEATPYEGRDQDLFNITDYISYIPTYKDLGIPVKSVDTNIKKGSSWWTYRVHNAHGTTDLQCLMPPTNYSELAVTLRMLFLATEADADTCVDIVDWAPDLVDYGTHLRETPPNSNVRAFLALCHGPKEEWSNGHA